MKTVLYFRSYSNFNAMRKLAGVHRGARDFGWNILTIDTGKETSVDQIRTLIGLWRPDGIIIESAACNSDFPQSTYGKTPVVFIDRDPQAIMRPAFCVTHDSAAEARLAAKELFSLNLVSYAYVPWRQPLFWCRERETAFRQFMRFHGKSVCRFPGKDNPETMRYSGDELSAWLCGLQHPVGIFAANDYIGQQVIAAAVHAGLNVPGDIAVIGVDNEEIICENTYPTLSSVQPDFEGAGERSARLLQKLLHSPGLKPCEEQYGPLKLVRRESTLRLNTVDTFVSKALEQIRRKACDGLTAKDVLALFPVARRQAEIRFRHAVGHSILDEIQRVRIEKAKDLLSRREKLSLSAIANFCGYATPAALYKTFTKDTGITPSDWRARH